MIDAIDRSMLAFLQSDATLPYAELGERVGLSASSINDRLKRLRAKGVIRRVSAEVDAGSVGLGLMVIVLVEIGGIEAERDFLATVAALPAVTECHHVTGEFSYMLKVYVASTRAFEDLLNRHIKNLAGIRRTHSLIVLSSPKDSRQLPVDAVDAS